jgi:hypothetical protein
VQRDGEQEAEHERDEDAQPDLLAVTSRFDHSSERSSHSAVAIWLGAGRMKSSTPPRSA